MEGDKTVLVDMLIEQMDGSRGKLTHVSARVTPEQAQFVQVVLAGFKAAGPQQAPKPAPVLGTKENPHDTGAPSPKRGHYTLHPRVLNDYGLPKAFRDAAKRVFTGELKADYVTQVYLSDDAVLTEVLPNGKGQFYVAYRVPVRCSGWFGSAFVNVAANDLLKQGDVGGRGFRWSAVVKAERRRYRVWKDAQLKEAKCLTRKRIMKALAGPADAKFKMGDRVRHMTSYGEFLYVGQYGHGDALILGSNGRITGASHLNLTKANSKEVK